MVGSSRALRRLPSRKLRLAPYPIPSYHWKVSEKECGSKKTSVALEKKDWEDATCSVCMEYPHNAVLLLCSSHDKGCRPYMCGTSHRHSNCLDQFKKAYTKMSTSHHDPGANLGSNLPHSIECQKSEIMELTCPLCRGQVKGWTVVDPAREYLNNKKRSCMQDNCSFVGTYKELSKHVRSEHPSANPHEVDPVLEQKWRMLEHERERQDVISTIRSSMPRSVVFGDYVIEMSNSELNTDDEVGDDHGDLDLENRGITRSILYFFLRESAARLMRLHRDNGEPEERGNDNLVDAYSLDGDDDMAPITSQGSGLGILRSERRHRRRRNMSRARPVSD
ncbi:hypothetical protein OPV22_011207 [Ensete ventricosum]|uniref:C2H2-type domain-containing protein n=1 Tax=Ensete ventricosum TaxID=4639 RepID=A0AAV8RF56_ENSVE|nr:hypothetical protein OPV22_011207 [Ensete ventricosum]